MKKLQLIIRGNTLRQNHLTVGNWKFHKVVFRLVDDVYNEAMLSSLKTIGYNIREIDFYFCHNITLDAFKNILMNFPKVEKLSFLHCSFKYDLIKIDTKCLELENLKELVLDDCCLNVNYDLNLYLIVNFNFH